MDKLKIREIKKDLEPEIEKIAELNETELKKLHWKLENIVGIIEKWKKIEKAASLSVRERKELFKKRMQVKWIMIKDNVKKWKARNTVKLDKKREILEEKCLWWKKEKYDPWLEKMKIKLEPTKKKVKARIRKMKFAINHWIKKRKIELEYLSKRLETKLNKRHKKEK